MNRQLYGSASLDTLVSNTDVASGDLNLCLDFGNDGVCDFTHNATTNFPATLTADGFSTALNNYLLTRNDVPWGDPIDVPVRVQIDRAAQVMLTNLQLTPSGAKTRFLRLPANLYSDLRLGLKFLSPGVSSGPLSFAVDVGANGSVDWSYAGAPKFPAQVESGNLAAAVNGYLSGRSGEVDVPLRIIPSPYLDTYLENARATSAQQPDLALGENDISFDVVNPIESDSVMIQATLHNNGGLENQPVVASFFAQAPGWGDWYLGSQFVPAIQPGSSTTFNLAWDTTGFYGDLPVKVVVDPYGRISETSKTNNLATRVISIRTRPDLTITDLNMPEVDLVDTVTATIPLRLDNLGQTDAAGSVIALYDGNPQEGGVLIGETTFPAAAESQTPLSFEWIPNRVGAHRLFAIADRDGTLNEANKNNNLAWKDIVVGLKSPVLMDSGASGSDPEFDPLVGYGFIDEGLPDSLTTCSGGQSAEYTLRRDPDGQVLYKFDHLVPSHYYHLDVLLYECDGAGRQESVVVDGYVIAGPEDLGDGEVHRLSLLIDPALYVDRTLDIAIHAPGIGGAVVGAINLHDVDYRYIDAGNFISDLVYDEIRGFGWTELESTASIIWGNLPYQSLRRDQSINDLTYRFDRLRSDRNYKIHLTFWQKEGAPFLQKVLIDGKDTNLMVNTGDFEIHRETIYVPYEAYYLDGSIQVTVQRLGAIIEMVNEISLEEETLTVSDQQTVTPTPFFSDVFGDVNINVTEENPGESAPIGAIIDVYDPRGVLVGSAQVTSPGAYSYLRIYGEDPTATPPILGMRADEMVSFRINGAPAVAKPSFYWQDDHQVHRVDLSVGEINQQSVLLRSGWNFISFYYEPPSPILGNVLQSIYGRYDRVLSETGIFASQLDDSFNTLNELHSGMGYYIRTIGTTSSNLLVDGIHQSPDTPLILNQGWNWIGFLPSIPLPIGEALNSIEGKYQIVHNLLYAYNPADIPRSNLFTMTPGEGYMIYMNEAAQLVYPTQSSGHLPDQKIASFNPYLFGVKPTPDFMTVYGQVRINGAPAPAGTIVQVRTPKGEIAGAVIVQQTGVLGFIHIFGDPNGEIGAFQEGEALEFLINGLPAQASAQLTWENQEMSYSVDLSSTQSSIFFPVIIR